MKNSRILITINSVLLGLLAFLTYVQFFLASYTHGFLLLLLLFLVSLGIHIFYFVKLLLREGWNSINNHPAINALVWTFIFIMIASFFLIGQFAP